MNPEKTGKLITELRKKNNLTQQDLAEKIGVTRKAISRWETGRGYPDIEILPKLADALSTTINELLIGETISDEQMPAANSENLNYICENVAKIKKQKKALFISLLCIVLPIVMIVAILIGYDMYQRISYHFDFLMGSENCIVAEDYSYIMYYGEKYVPLDTKGYEGRLGEQIIDEAMVENSSIFVKFFFGEQVYAINGISDSVMIYLCTDYDFNPSDYYVKESELEYMESIIENFSDEYYCAVITQRNSDWRDIILNEEFLPMINSLEHATQDMNENCDILYTEDQESIPIVIYESNQIFYREYGELQYKNSQYYWYDYNGHPYPLSVADENHPYIIEKQYYDILNQLFSYMHK